MATATEERLEAKAEQVRRGADIFLRLSRPWAVAMVVAAILSAATITIDGEHVVSGSWEISGITILLLAMIWLPAVIRVLAVAGGDVKTPAGEAATPGLIGVFESMDADTKRSTIPSVLAALTTPQVLTDPERREQSEVYRRDLELQLAAVVPHGGGVREALDRYAQRYEHIRRDTAPSRERTLQMTTLTAEARAIARAAPLSVTDLRNMLANGGDGERVIALALLQDHPDQRLLDAVCDAIVHSRSAFEQYQALAAAFEAMTDLDLKARDILREALHLALEDPERDIAGDTSRYLLVDAILTAMGDSVPS